jgi:hypothetical protein
MAVVLVLDSDRYRAASALGARNNAIELLELLGRQFDDVADLLLHLLGRGPGIGSNNQSVFDRELGIFQPRQMNVRPNSQHDHEDGKDEGDRLVSNRRLGNIHGRRVRGCSLASAAPSSPRTKTGRRR